MISGVLDDETMTDEWMNDRKCDTATGFCYKDPQVSQEREWQIRLKQGNKHVSLNQTYLKDEDDIDDES